MRKLQNYLKLLSLGSIVVLSMTTISCSINNSNTKNNPVIPTTNKNPNNNLNPNFESDNNKNNNLAPDNEDFKPSNNDSNQGSNRNSANGDNQINNNYSNSETIAPIDNSGSDTFNKQTYFSTISNLNHDLTSLENNYLEKVNKDFNEININENDIKNIILKNKMPINFYSHPKYKLENQSVTLDKFANSQAKLKLVDRDTNREIPSDQIKWYQQISYPEDMVITTNEDQSKATFLLSSDGTIKWKDTKEEDGREVEEKSARLWANYKGYLYSAVIKVYSTEKSKILKDEDEAVKMAKKIVNDNGWKNLPVLEKLTKAYEWMTKNVKYDYDLTTGPILKNQNAHSALVNLQTVCTGYAKGLKLILEELGIPCKFMEGQSKRETSHAKHAWNLVQLDNEWYHIDTTSDRTDNITKFNFFLNTNDDFLESDIFDNKFKDQGSRLRNLKFKNFVETEEDVLVLIDNNFNPTNNLVNKINMVVDRGNFSIVNNALKKRELDVHNWNYGTNTSASPNKSIIYAFNNYSKQKVESIKVKNVTQYNDKNAIKIELDKEIKDLKAGNFNISNALIRRIQQLENAKTYILYLEHFSSFGEINVKLESIKRKGFKFELDKEYKIKFNIKKQEKPDIKIQSIDNNKIKISNETNNLEYSFNYNSWKDVPTDGILKDATIGKLYLRYKETEISPSSDIIVFEIQKASEVDKLVKIVNGNMLIGLDYSMEYKKENDKKWTSLSKTILRNLDKGTYWIRTKASGSTLASDILKVEIK
ncbi:MAG6410 family transglutaminase-related lipoprotein [Mycoplasma mycoides]|uniref:MAG6410 family transglutaminase-related lipoprotein n=1 Tax=Mycoplasma mycoides TaxID=2102 RepID=UPI00223EB7B9|nr:transglutaminase domain-containing protein [Mycoplasma mycoides]QVK03145.1 lipoprotein [Mycoplasma mycoides subsp. capri]QVK03961.1 lipoprotein [Mycoplasma mycoides subsp. capri]